MAEERTRKNITAARGKRERIGGVAGTEEEKEGHAQ